jgi:hypothetical protein
VLAKDLPAVGFALASSASALRIEARSPDAVHGASCDVVVGTGEKCE